MFLPPFDRHTRVVAQMLKSGQNRGRIAARQAGGPREEAGRVPGTWQFKLREEDECFQSARLSESISDAAVFRLWDITSWADVVVRKKFSRVHLSFIFERIPPMLQPHG
jgi:hypothetical protein